MSKILVFAELKDKELRNVSFETIAAAKRLDDGAEVVASVFGESTLEPLANGSSQYGAVRPVTVPHEKLANYTSDGFTQAAMAVIEEEDPDTIIIGHTSIGKDLSPRLASKLDTGLISD